MKTNGIPAIVMLIAGGLYCLLGIYYQVPLMDFFVQLLLVLLVFLILGGIIRMVLDHFMGEIEDKAKDKNEKAEEKDAKRKSKAKKNQQEDMEV